MIENSDVLKIAGLSRLALTEEEVTLYSNQLSAILEHIEKLKELDTRDVGPTSHVLDIQNVMREDRTASSLAVDEALGNCPDPKDGFYRVPRILE